MRSKPSAELPRPLDNPEQLLRKHRLARIDRTQFNAGDRPQSLTRDRLQRFTESIKASLAEQYRSPGDGDPEQSNGETDTLSEDTSPQLRFYRAWGYLPPLDEEAVSVINAIIENPEMAKKCARLTADSPKFPEGLQYRNVFLTESTTVDPCRSHIGCLTPGKSNSETVDETKLYGQLWTCDQAKCNSGSNEALFQRTLMMSLIARHSFIYREGVADRFCLDFSVEESWSCPPMPTRAYQKSAQYLTQPKPDLAVCFCRQALIPDNLWNNMPAATRNLACYEGIDEIKGTRIFHFFTIEAKKANTGTGDTVGRRQCLNNASQALHNMFEFFRDAGPSHEEKFFEKVRFFSVVASTEGLTVRIHRATREPEDGSGQGFIMPDRPDYPLRFEHQEFANIQKRRNFDRKTVFETFGKILIAYGAGELADMLSDAARSIMKKLEMDLEGMRSREDLDFYRYGQTIITPDSRIPTPAQSHEPSKSITSVDMLRSRTATPTLGRAVRSKTGLNAFGKRNREESEDGAAAASTRQRN